MKFGSHSLLSLGLAIALSATTLAEDLLPSNPCPNPFTDNGTSMTNCCPTTSSCGSTGLNCTSTDGCLLGGSLLGFVGRSDQGFCSFISPMSNPVYFEDPRTLTEARAIFANHHLPSALGGGNVQLYALQLRAALTEDLSFIATKDGFFVSQSGVLNDGWADVNAGLKYNLYKNYETQTILSSGFTYGIPMGSHSSLQGKGSGEFNLFVTGGQQLGDDWHVLSTFGARIPANTVTQSQSTYWSNHLDRRLGDTGFYLFTEANWYRWMSSGNSFPLPVEGLDLFNLGSTNVAGNNIVTGAFGVKYKPSNTMEIGVAYELPYTSRRDIIQDRITADLIIRY